MNPRFIINTSTRPRLVKKLAATLGILAGIFLLGLNLSGNVAPAAWIIGGAILLGALGFLFT